MIKSFFNKVDILRNEVKNVNCYIIFCCIGPIVFGSSQFYFISTVYLLDGALSVCSLILCINVLYWSIACGNAPRKG